MIYLNTLVECRFGVEGIKVTIKWNSYLWEKPVTAEKENIEEIENLYGITFPNNYLEVLRENQGRIPDPNTIKIGKATVGAGVLYHFNNEEFEAYSVKRKTQNYKDEIPNKIIPFMGTGGGSDFGFDFRESSNNPKVVFIISDFEGEEAIRQVANTFTEFLSRL